MQNIPLSSHMIYLHCFILLRLVLSINICIYIYMYIYLFFKKYHLYICICMYICIHARIVFFVGLRSNATPHTRSHERCSPQARRMCENAMARHLSISETLYSLFCFLPQFFISFSLSFFFCIHLSSTT